MPCHIAVMASWIVRRCSSGRYWSTCGGTPSGPATFFLKNLIGARNSEEVGGSTCHVTGQMPPCPMADSLRNSQAQERAHVLPVVGLPAESVLSKQPIWQMQLTITKQHPTMCFDLVHDGSLERQGSWYIPLSLWSWFPSQCSSCRKGCGTRERQSAGSTYHGEHSSRGMQWK